jgi:hypothetical protein
VLDGTEVELTFDEPVTDKSGRPLAETTLTAELESKTAVQASTIFGVAQAAATSAVAAGVGSVAGTAAAGSSSSNVVSVWGLVEVL